MANRYIVDANVFVQGKNFHYDFSFCRGFWDWIEIGHEAGVIFSIRKVRDELLRGKKGDAAREWALAMPDSFFLDDVADLAVMKEYANVIQWAASNQHYKPQAKNDFADANRADAFLLACAKVHGYCIVTQEHHNPEKKVSIPIPTAAIALGNIPTRTIFETLRKHAVPTFMFKR
ncbi:DUF4411 family protein [Luteimonas sp. SMYT11W]|uniref:DUF4411 family protein n=1 Tax=Luteimonas flava TaxID=3115822 RepID=A0ABU7WGT8_9GAMM